MDNKISILVTGVGAPGTVGTLYSLRKNLLNINFHIIGTDMDSEAVGRYLVENFYTVPSADNEEKYINKILEICNLNRIQFILPQTTKEVELLSKHKDFFESEGIKIITSDYSGLSLSNNKCKLLEICKINEIPYPEFKVVSYVDELIDAILEFGYPNNNVVVKPCFSNGLRGVRIITTKHLSPEYFYKNKPNGLFITLDELKKTFSKLKMLPQDLVVQEYLPGEEYTIDVFRWKDLIVAIPRKRVKIKSGISFENIIEYNQELIENSKKLSNILNLKYCFGFQFKLDKNGVPKILESNPRVQGSMVASTFAGFNMIFFSIFVEINESKALELIKNYKLKIKWNSKFKRYWGGIGIDATGSFLGRI